jgi:hypothetical protein
VVLEITGSSLVTVIPQSDCRFSGGLTPRTRLDPLPSSAGSDRKEIFGIKLLYKKN